ncbi:DUF5777 family beta-barrel protein [uncultured Hymenobacter sp.]|uniref:DUF5777 family beta-barrel protein n=1 Tax=uncultured Hymenobacter sp. TaxID=170016 RepID=UPI0035CAC0F7
MTYLFRLLTAGALLLSCAPTTYGQDDLSQLFATPADSLSTARKPVTATFKAPRVINLRSTEGIARHELDFQIMHRFGDIAGKAGGVRNFFGLDYSTDIRIALDYGLTDRLTVGLARAKGISAVRELYEGSAKYKLLEQNQGNSRPVSVALFGNAVVSGMKATTDESLASTFSRFANRWSYVGQLIVARKFNERLSLALLPTVVHRQFVEIHDDNTVYGLGAAGRFKLTQRLGLIADYVLVRRSAGSRAYYRSRGVQFYNPLGLGLEMETGGHVFAMTFTNSTALLENQFIPETRASWAKGEFRWGFTISRRFALGGKKKG